MIPRSVVMTADQIVITSYPAEQSHPFARDKIVGEALFAASAGPRVKITKGRDQRGRDNFGAAAREAVRFPDDPVPAPVHATVCYSGGVDMADTRRLPGPNADLWDWQLHAACRGMASSYFFHPEGERGPARVRREAKAKAVCQECPAMLACRAHALEVHEPYGIWGGMSEGERQQLLATSVRAG